MRGRSGRLPAGGGGGTAEKLSAYLAGRKEQPVTASSVRGGVLADTCAWIDYFRPRESPLSRALDRALRGDQICVCGQVMLELLQGVRSGADQSALIAALGALEYLEMRPSTWMSAAEMSSALRRKGRQLPHSDLLIAALALEHDLAVLTVDKHFSEIPGLALCEF